MRGDWVNLTRSTNNQVSLLSALFTASVNLKSFTGRQRFHHGTNNITRSRTPRVAACPRLKSVISGAASSIFCKGSIIITLLLYQNRQIKAGCVNNFDAPQHFCFHPGCGLAFLLLNFSAILKLHGFIDTYRVGRLYG